MCDSAIDTILFDLDDTLCTYRRPGEEVLALAFDSVDVEPFFSYDAYRDRIETLDVWCETFAEFRAECFASLAREHDREPALGRAVARAFASERDQRNVNALPGATRALEALSQRYSLGMVTNGGPDIQRDKLAAIGLDEHFDVIVYAGFDAPPKPDPEPFTTALGELDSSPERAVHVGNSIADDVAGARAAGVRSVWLDDGSNPDPTPDYVIGSLEDLTSPPWE